MKISVTVNIENYQSIKIESNECNTYRMCLLDILSILKAFIESDFTQIEKQSIVKMHNKLNSVLKYLK